MSENILELKKIGAIIKEETCFFVDTYQRGYKWDKQQIKELLNDINEFEIGDNNEFYCLQPVVVKKKENKMELIDGQQRMTSIFIILSFLNKDKFTIDYQTRQKSAFFLSHIITNNKIQINDWKAFKTEEFDNIDNYHFFNAYVEVKNWFENKTEDQKITFYNKLTNYTKVIWYENIEKNSENEKIKSQELFARINIGKIPLTNSELIKALFLSDKNLDDTSKNEIAMEWDIIENTLQNDDLWYFISDDKSYPSTRIDLIFDLISNKDRESKKNEDLFSFHFFNINSNNKTTLEYWQEVTRHISLIQDWFENVQLFHLVGYSIETSGKNKLKNLIKLYYEAKGSEIFLFKLEEEIKNSEAIKRFDDLRYGSGLVKNALLLFNVKTHIKISNKDNSQKFPFKSYKKNKWTVEHIHAQNSESLNSREQWKQWLDDAIEGLKNLGEEAGQLIKKIENENNPDLTKEKFEILFSEVQKISSDANSSEELHSIDNLALLDGNTNSSISNNIFAVKRNMIIAAEVNDYFIPICTKNVFLKYYSEKPKHIFFWSNKDREDYLNSMKNILDILITKKDNKCVLQK